MRKTPSAAPERFDDQFDELTALAYRIAYRILGDRGEAEEVAQEAMIRAYTRWRTVQGYPRPWVSRVATNQSIGVLRKRRTPPATATTVLDGADVALERMELQRHLVSLPRRQREVVALRYLADLSEADVARGLGCSVGAVKRHARRGLEAMRISLDAQLSEAC
jgi:RNA polymerase sigma factor (sigma-70 family)